MWCWDEDRREINDFILAAPDVLTFHEYAGADRTQTHFPWESAEGAPPPSLWFHDLLDGRGRPYREEEIALIQQVIRAE